MEANSQPTYPPPRISRRSGSRSSRRIVSEVHTAASATPGRSGTAGVVPVLITTSRPRTRRTPPSRVRISTVRGPTKRAVPRMKSMPDSANIFSWADTIPPTTDSLCRRRASREIAAVPSSSTPILAAFRATSRVRADPTSALVGMQATLMQVPPILSRSTMTTGQPALARSIARDFPALPPPTTRSCTSSTSWSTTTASLFRPGPPVGLERRHVGRSERRRRTTAEACV